MNKMRIVILVLTPVLMFLLPEASFACRVHVNVVNEMNEDLDVEWCL